MRAISLLKDNNLLEQKILIVGAGPQAQEYHALSNELGLNEFVDFENSQPARTAFAKAKYLVMPSRNESLPYVLLESIGANMPVIATNVGGISEIMLDQDPFLVESENAEILSEKMAEYLADPKMAKDFAQKRWNKISKEFSIKTMIQKIEDVYDDQLNNK